MKVVVLHTDFRIYWPARLNALQKYLSERNIEMEVVEIAGEGSPYAFADKTENESHIPWHILFPNRKMETLSGGEIKRPLYDLLDNIRPDVVVAGAIAFPSGALAVSWARSRNQRVVIFDDSKVDVVPRSGLVNKIKQAVYNGVDAVVYPADGWKETGNYWGFCDERMYYGIDVVDNDFWSQVEKKENKKFPFFFFLTAGRQLERKNFPTLLRAYAQYVQRIEHKPIELVMVGDGPLHDSLIALAEELGVSSYVHFVTFLQQKELRGYYQNCRAFVLPSHEETWGLVINEAMASGALVIASQQCGAAEVLVQEGRNGYIFDHMDEDALVDRLISVHNMTDEQHQSMCDASRKIINSWGLPRFCEGCHDAIIYAASAPCRKTSLVDDIIIRLWKGRYRPK